MILIKFLISFNLNQILYKFVKMSKLAVFKSNRAQRPAQHKADHSTHHPLLYEEGSKTTREKSGLKYTAKEHLDYLQ